MINKELKVLGRLIEINTMINYTWYTDENRPNSH